MTDQLGHRDCGNLPHLVDVNAVVVMSDEDPQGTDISPREAGTSGRKRITEGGARFTDDLEQPHGDATHSQQRPADRQRQPVRARRLPRGCRQRAGRRPGSQRDGLASNVIIAILQPTSRDHVDRDSQQRFELLAQMQQIEE